MNLALVPAVQSIVFDSSLIKNLRLHYIIQEKLSPSVPGRFCGSIRLKSCDVRVHWSLKHCRARDSIHQRFLCEVSALHFNRLTSSSQTLHTHTHTLPENKPEPLPFLHTLVGYFTLCNLGLLQHNMSFWLSASDMEENQTNIL